MDFPPYFREFEKSHLGLLARDIRSHPKTQHLKITKRIMCRPVDSPKPRILWGLSAPVDPRLTPKHGFLLKAPASLDPIRDHMRYGGL